MTRVAEAIEEIKQGRMVIMMDDEDRENEGDLVYAATFSTPEHVNFMATHAKGLICVTIENDVAARLSLAPMVQKNNSNHETAFTISVDAASATTGISAHERDTTIKILADHRSHADELVRPGHIFPLIAKEGGVLVRVGHTEGATDLCRLAGVAPVGVICEVMKDDGTMARRDDLITFGKEHGLKIIYISDLVEYRLKRESLVKVIMDQDDDFMAGTKRQIIFGDHLGRTHRVVVFGPLDHTMNVKFHNLQSDLALLTNHNRYHGLFKAVEALEAQGGVLVFLEGEGASGATIKEYGIGAQILHALGITHVKLLTSHATSEFAALGGFGLEIEKIVLG